MKGKINLVIDRFEENLAVLLDRKGQEINFPEKYLPKEAKEGDIIKFEFSINRRLTKKRTKGIKQLIKKLKRNKP